MSIGKLGRSLAAMTALSACVLAWAQPAGPGMGAQGGMRGGGPLLSAEERAGFCDRMQASKTDEERRAVMDEAHRLMSERAAQRGMAPPTHARPPEGPPRGYGPGMRSQCLREIEPAPARSGAAAPAADAGRAVERLAEQSEQGIRYVSGGVGTDQVEAMQQVAGRYSMRLTFASTDGAYLADVTVRVLDAGGKTVFSANGVGPLLYVQIPPGKYRIIAVDSGGIERSARLAVPRNGAIRQTLRWPAV